MYNLRGWEVRSDKELSVGFHRSINDLGHVAPWTVCFNNFGEKFFFIILILIKLLPNTHGLEKDVLLLLVNKLGDQSINNNDERYLVLLFECIQNLNYFILQLHVKGGTALLNKLLWVNTFGGHVEKDRCVYT